MNRYFFLSDEVCVSIQFKLLRVFLYSFGKFSEIIEINLFRRIFQSLNPLEYQEQRTFFPENKLVSEQHGDLITRHF